jgi:alpha-L-arabinofuranosidase
LFVLFTGCSTQTTGDSPESLTTLSLPTSTPVLTPVPGGLFVDGGFSLGPISPLVYGTNYGPWLGVSLEVQPTLKELGLTYIRFPGGHWGDTNETTEAQIDLLMYFANEWGAIPSISVRLPNSTPEEAAATVRYANITKGYNIRYWSISNEVNLFDEKPTLYPDGYTVEQFNEEWRAFALAMKAVDPTILLVGPDISQFIHSPTATYGQTFTDWLTSFLKVNGDLIDVVAVHRYPFPAGSHSAPPTKDELRNQTQEWDKLVPALRTIVHETTGRDLPLAITEVNSSWSVNVGGEGTMDSHYNAIWWADSLGRMIRQDVAIVAQFAVTGQFGMTGRYDIHPTAYVYQLYKNFGKDEIYASSDDPFVSIYAARREDGTLTLMIVNLKSETVNTSLMLANAQPGTAETWLLDPTHIAEQGESIALDATTLLTIPAESVTLLVLPQP